LDLTPFAAQLGWEARFIRPFWARFQADGAVWYIANSSSSWSYYYYNPDLFSDLGIVVPEGRVPTVEEFTGWRDTVKAAGLEFIALGNKDAWPAIHHLINMHRAFVPRDRLALLEGTALADTGVRFTDDDALRAIRRTQETFAEGFFAPGPNAMADGEALALFTSGKAALFQSGFWGAYVIPDAAPADFKLDLFHWPQEDPTIPKALWYGPGNGYCISARTEHQDECVAILDFIISAEGQQISLRDHGLLPTVNAETLPPEETTYPEPTALYGAIVEAQGRFGPDSSTFYISNIPEVATEANRMTQDLIDGRVTPEDFAAQLQQVNEDYRATLGS
jgi:ABC-type glycerol-3-phosphate transport system substrate-binding protein